MWGRAFIAMRDTGNSCFSTHVKIYSSISEKYIPKLILYSSFHFYITKTAQIFATYVYDKDNQAGLKSGKM